MKMIVVEIQGVKLEAALLNPKVAKRFDEGLRQVVEKANESAKLEVGAEAIEAQCNAVIQFIDDIFGPGSAKEVFGEETDLLTCLDAFGEMAELYDKQVKPVVDTYAEKFGKKERDA